MDLVSAAARGHRDCGRLRIFRIRAHSIDAKLLDGFYSGLYPHDPASKSVHKGDAIQRDVQGTRLKSNPIWRPFSGMSRISFESITSDTEPSAVSSGEAAPLTSTTWRVEPTTKTALATAFCPTAK